MTKTGPVGEQLIASADPSARRTRDALAAGERGMGEAADRSGFPELLTRLAATEPGRAHGPASGARSAESAEPGRSQSALWRHVGDTSDDVAARGGVAGEAPALGGDREGEACEQAPISDRACPGKDASGLPSSLRIEAVSPGFDAGLAGPAAKEDDWASLENGSRGRGPGISAAGLSGAAAPKALSREAAAQGNAVAELQVKVAVKGSETHFAPVVQPSLAYRPAVPASVNKASADKTSLARAIDAELTAEHPAPGPVAKTSDADIGRSPLKGDARGGEAQQFGQPRAARSANVRAVKGLGTEGSVGERTPGIPAAGPELRASSVSQPQPFAGLISQPVQQIADRIATELGGPAAGRAPGGHSAEPAGPGSGAQLRVLHIQLQPAELGIIEVRLSLKEDTLDIRLEAARHEAVALINRDKDALAGLLRSAGYLIDGLTVHTAEIDRSVLATGQSGSQGSQAQFQASTQSQSSWSQPDQQPSGTRQHAGNGHGSNPANRDDNVSNPHNSRPGDGALYV